MTWESLITVDEVIKLHAESLRHVNQDIVPIGAKQRDCVEARIKNAWSAEQYSSDTTRDVLEGLVFAGYLMFYLVQDHCFPDGNKRIGWVAAMTILTKIGLTVRSSTDQAVRLVEAISTNHIAEGATVVQWLAERLDAPR